MRAVVLERYGGPEVLRYRDDVATPKPREGEILLRVVAAGVNRVDIWIRKGVYKVNLPLILGADVAGRVEEVGDSSTLKRGDHVVVYPVITCGSCYPCLNGREDACEKKLLIGQNVNGGYAEYVSVPERCAFKLPDEIDPVDAAAIPVNFLTAYHMLVCSGNLSPGETVLIVGGGSGIGYAAIQIAKLVGATVITTVGDEWKVDRAYNLGADLVVNRKKQDVAEEVLKFTGGRGVEVVFEHVGKDFWATALKCLAPMGRLVTGGATTGSDVSMDVRALYLRRSSVIGSGYGTRADFVKILRLFSANKLKVLIDKVYNLKDASEAHERMENSEHFGKILLKP